MEDWKLTAQTVRKLYRFV